MAASCSVFLNVQDIQKSLDFYRSLGFRVTGAHKDETGKTGWADLEFQGAELGLGAIASNDDPEFRGWVGTPLGAGVIVTFTVTDVDRLWARAQAENVTVEMPLTDRPYGRMFTLNDPDGYVVSFLKEPVKKRAAAKKATNPAKKAGTTKKSARKGAKASSKKAAKAPAKKGTKRSAKKSPARR